MDLSIVLVVESRMVSIFWAHKVDVCYLDIFLSTDFSLDINAQLVWGDWQIQIQPIAICLIIFGVHDILFFIKVKIIAHLLNKFGAMPLTSFGNLLLNEIILALGSPFPWCNAFLISPSTCDWNLLVEFSFSQGVAFWGLFGINGIIWYSTTPPSPWKWHIRSFEMPCLIMTIVNGNVHARISPTKNLKNKK